MFVKASERLAITSMISLEIVVIDPKSIGIG